MIREPIPVLSDEAVDTLPGPVGEHYWMLRESIIDRLLPADCELCAAIRKAASPPTDESETSDG